MEQVKLFGAFPSPFIYRVIWALKLKGVQYDYIEDDDLFNKSNLLLEYNLVHNKKAIVLFVEFQLQMFWSVGEQQEKALKEASEVLKTIEECGGLGEKKFFGGDS
ncbi:PREDICTED: probable glutathione S-transferase [Nelumbo nucifera]|uniref:Glutathione S-transferase n=1 Tax=Nelumbo nucifera TaxID=4432 RepID=A0A1U7ZXF9_NELNU|nr:PREDICTED: probable glutathione S-transferase [Nelumbo nucifera]